MIGMKAVEVDPVVHDAQAIRWGAVAPADLRGVPARDGHHVPRGSKREDPPLEGEDQAVVGTPPDPTHGLEIAAMGPLARAVDVLAEAALVALDDVVAGPRDGAARGKREAQEPEHGGLVRHAESPHRGPRHIGLSPGAHEIDPVAAPDQLAQEAGRGGLDAAVE